MVDIQPEYRRHHMLVCLPLKLVRICLCSCMVFTTAMWMRAVVTSLM